MRHDDNDSEAPEPQHVTCECSAVLFLREGKAKCWSCGRLYSVDDEVRKPPPWGEDLYITKRVAVDIEGEEEPLRRVLRHLELLVPELRRAVNIRADLERDIAVAAGERWLCDSDRLMALHHALGGLLDCQSQLAEALVASGTVTDEPPF